MSSIRKKLTVNENDSKNTRMDIDCWRIAEYFQSSKILSTLKYIERFFPKLSIADRYH